MARADRTGWLTTQTVHNRSLRQIPGYQGKIQGNPRQPARLRCSVRQLTPKIRGFLGQFPMQKNREFLRL